MGLKWFRARMTMKKRKIHSTPPIGIYRSSQFDTGMSHMEKNGLNKPMQAGSMPSMNNPNISIKNAHFQENVQACYKNEALPQSTQSVSRSGNVSIKKENTITSDKGPSVLKHNPTSYTSDGKRKKARAPMPNINLSKQYTRTEINMTTKASTSHEN